MNTSSSPRRNQSIDAFEKLDAELRAWALGEGSEEWQFPVLISSESLRRAEYPEAFPHLLMASASVAQPDEPFSNENLQLTNWFLSPAVCYHAYAQLAEHTLVRGEVLTARGRCFRREAKDELAVGRRQVEFEMREVILVGEESWVGDRVATLKPDVERLARQFGLKGEWCAANDPFFLPRARGKAQVQRLLGTKIEFCLSDGLAVASINRHGPFFGERFNICVTDGSYAHSACIAFGLDRWVSHSNVKSSI